MAMRRWSLFPTIICALILGLWPFDRGLAQIEPPNYDFSLKTFETFMPGSNQKEVEALYPKGELLNKKGDSSTYRYYVAHIRYRFPVIVQYFQNKIIDSYATLPSYFLHDVFHQSLINKWGKQKEFEQKNGTSQYRWAIAQGISITYQATCTITCFPLFVAFSFDPLPEGAESAKPLLNQLQDARL